MLLNLTPQKKILLTAGILFTVSLSVIMFVFKEEMWQSAGNLKNQVLAAFLPSHEETDEETMYREIIDNHEDPIFVISENGNLTYISPFLEAALEYETHSLAETSLLELLHPDDVAIVMTAIMKIKEKNGKMESIGPYRLRKSDRTYRVHMASGAPIKKEHGIEIIFATKDITSSVEQLQKEEKHVPAGTKIKNTHETSPRTLVEKM